MTGNPEIWVVKVRERIQHYENELSELENRIQAHFSDQLKKTLGVSWIERIREEIQRCYAGKDPEEHSEPLRSEIAIPFFLLRHGRTLERFDECIRRIDAATKKKRTLCNQINRISHLDRGNVLGEIFEVFVVGEIARSGKLVDIAVRPSKDSSSDVDAMVRLGDREAYVECALITQDLGGSGPGLGSLSIDEMMAQMGKKITEKVESGRQLALVNGSAVLVVGLPQIGCDEQTAEWEIEKTWKEKRATKASAICVAGSWEMRGAKVYPNPNAGFPLTPEELEELQDVLNPSLPDDYDPIGVRLANEYLKRISIL